MLSSDNIRSISAITSRNICCGCGSCVVACNYSAINFKYGERFNYPEIDDNNCASCGKCIKVCPSKFLLQGTDPGFQYHVAPNNANAYLIHSSDICIRGEGSSGGFITGLFVYLLENKMIDGCIVTRCEGNNPIIAETFIATDKLSIISASGSKYAPVSNCVLLKDILNRKGKYAFVGTPCMLEGLTKLERYFPELKENIFIKIGFVCGGMASRLSTLNYIKNHGKVDLKEVHKINYRGNGWPGRFRVFGEQDEVLMDEPLIGGSLTYVVGMDLYLRCYNCLDHWSHFADIVVSDPWTEEMVKTEKIGRSAILIKSDIGRKVVLPAIQSKHFIAEEIPVNDMINFNKHLIINDNHEVHSWMLLYQLLFMRRIRYFLPIMKFFITKNISGVFTTVKALLLRKYYY